MTFTREPRARSASSCYNLAMMTENSTAHEDSDTPVHSLREGPTEFVSRNFKSTHTVSGALPKGRSVRLSDSQLQYLVASAERSVQWGVMSGIHDPGIKSSTGAWKLQKKSVNGFSTFTRSERYHDVEKKQKSVSVLSVGVIASCTVQEVQNIFGSLRGDMIQRHRDYNDTMSMLWGQDFVHGNILHHVGQDRNECNQKVDEDKTDRSISVKTAVFINHTPFKKQSERWAYLDFNRCKIDSNTKQPRVFNRICASLPPQDLFLSDTATPKCAYNELTNIVTSCKVGDNATSSSNARKSVRITFYGQAQLNKHHRKSRIAQASDFATRRRLLFFATATDAIPAIIQRRRLGMQCLVQHREVNAQNQRCICCTRRFGKFSRRKRRLCDLCGFYVCHKACSQIQERERYVKQGNNDAKKKQLGYIRICEQCLDKVALGNFDAIPTDLLYPGEIVPDTADKLCEFNSNLHKHVTNQLLNESADEQMVMKRLLQLLRQSNHATSLMKGMDRDNNAISADRSRSLEAEFDESAGLHRNDIARCMEWIIREALDLKRCVIGGRLRSYPLSYSSGASIPDCVRPPDDDDRHQVIVSYHIRELGYIPMLNAICRLAASVLNCMESVITVIDQDDMQLIASTEKNVPPGVILPRQHSNCAHLIMERCPVLYPHTPSDVRFHSTIMTREHNVYFYLGFPLYAPDNKTIIGSLCCVDDKTHYISQSEYTLLHSLSGIATDIIKEKSLEISIQGE